MILVADAHVSKIFNNHDEFFQMLALIESLDRDVVFLGDIFDLWIALPRYQEEIQKRFLEWCRRYKRRRMVGFVEGNREFWVVKKRSDCFSWSTESFYWDKSRNLLFVHGDQINRKDWRYLSWRKVSKNGAMRKLVRFLPFGPRIAHRLKKKLETTNMEFRIGLPEEELRHFAQSRFDEGAARILAGHFHRDYSFPAGEDRWLRVLPDWYSTRLVGIYDEKNTTCKTVLWQDLAKATAAEDGN